MSASMCRCTHLELILRKHGVIAKRSRMKGLHSIWSRATTCLPRSVRRGDRLIWRMCGCWSLTGRAMKDLRVDGDEILRRRTNKIHHEGPKAQREALLSGCATSPLVHNPGVNAGGGVDGAGGGEDGAPVGGGVGVRGRRVAGNASLVGAGVESLDPAAERATCRRALGE